MQQITHLFCKPILQRHSCIHALAIAMPGYGGTKLSSYGVHTVLFQILFGYLTLIIGILGSSGIFIWVLRIWRWTGVLQASVDNAIRKIMQMEEKFESLELEVSMSRRCKKCSSTRATDTLRSPSWLSMKRSHHQQSGDAFRSSCLSTPYFSVTVVKRKNSRSNSART